MSDKIATTAPGSSTQKVGEQSKADSPQQNPGQQAGVSARPKEQEEKPSFIASSSFSGALPGYVFKTGDQGLGYYVDISIMEVKKQQQEQAKAKPAVIKSNKSIVKIPGRGPSADAPAAKKAKTTDDKPKYLKELDTYRAMSCGSDTKHDRPLVK
mmetsp:Transcript_40427/g.89803  ORF Transcript_40427/g.89803 Transcript_40427/m.89803 type:complete len:155 (+) Transcript_40427:137-601(+)|eukprot:CAMPEP_0202900558 /NCGR_PEP_ID=MMETSP1392-20130828/11906_1 /ASSEMBLY_ACC=CAM_ASM_000868 /TAXON_ID=225041 /ORGANISM="Chlamydomonas chlamydogama, Strain SAG 11-48b" /LENGTH=154 /DNA_ID=CAMNT_0049586973 /DNA_START=137 /DNA_END=601 /DNA_ORIENTATION=-